MINTGPWGMRRERWLCKVEQSIAPLVSSIHHQISNHGRSAVDRSRSVQNFRSSPAALHHRRDRTWTPSISLSETLELELIPLVVIIHLDYLLLWQQSQCLRVGVLRLAYGGRVRRRFLCSINIVCHAFSSISNTTEATFDSLSLPVGRRCRRSIKKNSSLLINQLRFQLAINRIPKSEDG